MVCDTQFLAEDMLTGATGADDPASPLRWLFADFLVCAAGGTRPRRGLPAMGLGGQLALAAHEQDRDDIEWTLMIHQGSIVWASVLAAACSAQVAGPTLRSAAWAGYQCGSDVARILGTNHASRWHLTSTSGYAAAAAAASTVFELNASETATALSHALSVAGGVGQAVRERSGTTGFHRAAAVEVGLMAAVSAAQNVPASLGTLAGELGVQELMGSRRFTTAPATTHESTRTSAVATTSIRLYPANGLMQSLYEVVAECRARLERPSNARATLALPRAVVANAAPRGSGGWWDIDATVRRAWRGDANAGTSRVGTPETPPLVELDVVAQDDVSLGWAQFACESERDSVMSTARDFPGRRLEVSKELVGAKWRDLLPAEMDGEAHPLAVADRILDLGSSEVSTWVDTWRSHNWPRQPGPVATT